MLRPVKLLEGYLIVDFTLYELFSDVIDSVFIGVRCEVFADPNACLYSG
jgi:hypothetical protein